MLAFAGRRMAVSGEMMRWFFVGTGAGGMSLPWLSGLLFEGFGPRSVMVAIMLDLILALLVFLYCNAKASEGRPSGP
jgi:predicted MFS family arabinose efflux permease